MRNLLIAVILLFVASCSHQTYPPDGDQRSDSTYSNYYEGYYTIDEYYEYFLYPYGFFRPSGYFYAPYCSPFYDPYHWHYPYSMHYLYYPHNYNYHYFKPIPGYQGHQYRSSSTPAQTVRYHGNRPSNQHYRQAPAARPQPQHYYTPHTTMPISRPQMHSPSGGGGSFRPRR